MMTPDEAGAALAADPTFRLMSREEQAQEAARLLGGFNSPSDDPLDIAVTIEIAETIGAAPAPHATPEAGLEVCRLNGAEGPPCNGSEPVAGNGRCMTCGAIRRVAEAPAAAATAPPAVPAPRQPETAATPPAPALRHGVSYDPGGSFIGRFKESTGATDREVAGMLGMSRATVQAYSCGRLPEKLDGLGAAVLMADLAERLVLLADLRRDLAVSLGVVD